MRLLAEHGWATGREADMKLHYQQLTAVTCDNLVYMEAQTVYTEFYGVTRSIWSGDLKHVSLFLKIY